MDKGVWRVNLDCVGEPMLALWVGGEMVEAFAPCQEDENGKLLPWAESWACIFDVIENYNVRPEWLS